MDRRDTRFFEIGGQADVEVEPEWRRQLVAEEASQASMRGVDTSQQLALEPTQADCVIAVAGAGLPGRLLPGEDLGQTVEVREDLGVESLVDPGQPRLVCAQLAHRHVLLASLGELRPVPCDRGVPIEQLPRMGERQR